MTQGGKSPSDEGVSKQWVADKFLIAIVSLLLCFGFVMIYSASALEADEKYGNALHLPSDKVPVHLLAVSALLRCK